MVAGVLATGFSQEFFQLAPSPAAVTAQLGNQPAHSFGLRLNLGLDNLFIVVYCAFFVFVAVRLHDHLSRVTIGVALGSILLTGLLDAVENHHILAVLHAFQDGAPISSEEMQLQFVASNLKFHGTYVATFLFAFGFYRLGGLGRFIAFLLWFGYVPLGMITFAVPTDITAPFALTRTAFFVLAFALAGVFFWRDTGASGKADMGQNAEKIGARA
jgi:hypothetical protein